MNIPFETFRHSAAANLGVLPVLALLVAGAGAGCEAFGVRSGGDGPTVLTARGTPGSGKCVGRCDPDPGWSPVNCKVSEGIKKLPLITFDEAPNSTGDKELGQLLYADGIIDEPTATVYDTSADDLYVYTDGTAVRRFEYKTPKIPSYFLKPLGGWQPPTRKLETPICAPGTCTTDAQNNAFLCNNEGNERNSVLHLLGGPFTGWGGGMGIAMQKMNGRPTNAGQEAGSSLKHDPTAPIEPKRITKNLCLDSPPASVCPPETADYAVRVAALDVSEYDGVSFWARRGPNGQPGIRVNVGDKGTDDDISYLTTRYNATHPDEEPQPLYCQRLRECACRNHKACKFRKKPEALSIDPSFAEYKYDEAWYCGTEKQDGDLSSYSTDLSGAGSVVVCGQTACDRHYPAYQNDYPDGGITDKDKEPVIDSPRDEKHDIYGSDVQFSQRPCTPYAFPNGVVSSYCYDPKKDPPPIANVDQCGDHWMTTVNLTTDWQFFKVPFKILRQQGWAKKSPQLDLHSVSVVRFTWDIGWIDYWFDDVAFYKNTD